MSDGLDRGNRHDATYIGTSCLCLIFSLLGEIGFSKTLYFSISHVTSGCFSTKQDFRRVCLVPSCCCFSSAMKKGDNMRDSYYCWSFDRIIRLGQKRRKVFNDLSFHVKNIVRTTQAQNEEINNKNNKRSMRWNLNKN